MGPVLKWSEVLHKNINFEYTKDTDHIFCFFQIACMTLDFR